MSLQINKRQFKKWIAALDSGEYKQGKGELQNQYGHCCIGVGCIVTVPTYLLEYDSNGFLDGGIAEDQPSAPKWLQEIDGDFIDNTGRSLMSLNDDKGYTFPEIATLLELVYVHKMLD